MKKIVFACSLFCLSSAFAQAHEESINGDSLTAEELETALNLVDCPNNLPGASTKRVAQYMEGALKIWEEYSISENNVCIVAKEPERKLTGAEAAKFLKEEDYPSDRIEMHDAQDFDGEVSGSVEIEGVNQKGIIGKKDERKSLENIEFFPYYRVSYLQSKYDFGNNFYRCTALPLLSLQNLHLPMGIV